MTSMSSSRLRGSRGSIVIDRLARVAEGWSLGAVVSDPPGVDHAVARLIRGLCLGQPGEQSNGIQLAAIPLRGEFSEDLESRVMTHGACEKPRSGLGDHQRPGQQLSGAKFQLTAPGCGLPRRFSRPSMIRTQNVFVAGRCPIRAGSRSAVAVERPLVREWKGRFRAFAR